MVLSYVRYILRAQSYSSLPPSMHLNRELLYCQWYTVIVKVPKVNLSPRDKVSTYLQLSRVKLICCSRRSAAATRANFLDGLRKIRLFVGSFPLAQSACLSPWVMVILPYLYMHMRANMRLVIFRPLGCDVCSMTKWCPLRNCPRKKVKPTRPRGMVPITDLFPHLASKISSCHSARQRATAILTGSATNFTLGKTWSAFFRHPGHEQSSS